MSTLSTSRHLGTQSGATSREARKLKRGGFRAAAAQMAFDASQQRLGEGGAIRKAGMRETEERLQGGLMESRRRGLMGRESDDGATQPATGATASTPSPSAESQRQSRMKFYTDQQRSRMGSYGNTPAPAAASLTTSPSVETNYDGTQTPTAPRPTLSRPSLIDGKPAASVLAGMRGSQPDAAEPGNMAQVRAATIARTPGQDYETNYDGTQRRGPLQTALDEALARNDGRAKDAVAAGKLTAGLNAAPTPTLDTSFPKARELAGPPRPVASAPAPERSFAYRLGQGIRATPGDVASTIKRTAGKASDAVGGAVEAVATGIGNTGLRTGRKLKRATSDFRSGLFGR